MLIELDRSARTFLCLILQHIVTYEAAINFRTLTILLANSQCFNYENPLGSKVYTLDNYADIYRLTCFSACFFR
jgi:hypothetical protein